MCNHLIQNQVDFILFEEGSFSPLSWLLREGHLDYREYLNWRKGTSSYLEDHFKISTSTIMTALEQAQAYLNKLKLSSFRQNYLGITRNQPLRFCRSQAHEVIFITIYEPAQDRLQMDLFLDSADVCVASDLIRAIVDKRITDMDDLVTKLEVLNPGKHQKFTQLLAIENKITHARISSEKKIELLLQTLTPLAFDVLGRFSHDFLTPLWHKLSEDIADKYFDLSTPEYHLSYTAFKGFQWQKVISSIEREKNWSKQPLLIFRYAESCFKLNKEYVGLASWFSLFILFPETAERLIKDSCNRLMYSDWQSFLELDPELVSTLFPAWMVIEKPALAKQSVISGLKYNESLQWVVDLISISAAEINETAIQHRTQLQKNSPALFAHYMGINEMDQGV